MVIGENVKIHIAEGTPRAHLSFSGKSLTHPSLACSIDVASGATALLD